MGDELDKYIDSLIGDFEFRRGIQLTQKEKEIFKVGYYTAARDIGKLETQTQTQQIVH